MKRMMQWLIAALIVSQSSAAFALFDAQALYGRRWLSSETDGEKSGTAFSAITLAGHVGFLPIVSFGASFTMMDALERDKESSGLDTLKAQELALDILAEIPLIPIVTPYGRLVVPVWSKIEASAKEEFAGQTFKSEIEGSYTGHLINVGIEYSPIPLLGIHLEAGKGVFMTKTDKAELNGDEVDDINKDRDGNAVDTVMLGVSVGF